MSASVPRTTPIKKGDVYIGDKPQGLKAQDNALYRSYTKCPSKELYIGGDIASILARPEVLSQISDAMPTNPEFIQIRVSPSQEVYVAPVGSTEFQKITFAKTPKAVTRVALKTQEVYRRMQPILKRPLPTTMPEVAPVLQEKTPQTAQKLKKLKKEVQGLKNMLLLLAKLQAKPSQANTNPDKLQKLTESIESLTDQLGKKSDAADLKSQLQKTHIKFEGEVNELRTALKTEKEKVTEAKEELYEQHKVKEENALLQSKIQELESHEQLLQNALNAKSPDKLFKKALKLQSTKSKNLELQVALQKAKEAKKNYKNEVENLKATLDTAEKKANLDQMKLDYAKNAFKAQEKEYLNDLNDAELAFKDQISSLDNQLQDTLEKLEHVNNKLKNQNKKNRHLQKNLQNEKKALEMQATKFQSAIEAKNNLIAELESRPTQKQLDAVQEMLSQEGLLSLQTSMELKDEKYFHEQDVARLNNKLSAQKETLEENLKKLEEVLEAQKDGLNDQIKKLKNDNSTLTLDNIYLEGKNKVGAQALEEEAAKVAEHTADLTSKTHTIKNLENSRNDLQSELERLEMEKASAIQEVNDHKQLQFETQIKMLQAQVEVQDEWDKRELALHQELERMDKQVKELTEEKQLLDIVNQAIRDEGSKKEAALQNQIEATERSEKYRQLDNEEFKQQKETLNQTISSYQEEDARVAQAFNKERELHDQFRIDQFKLANEIIDNLQTNSSELGQLKDDQEDLLEQIETLKQEKKDWIQANDQNQDQINEQELIIKDLEANLAELNSTIDEYEEENQKLFDENEILQDKLNEAEINNNNLLDQAENMFNLIKENDSATLASKAQIDQQSSKIANLNNTLSKLTELIKKSAIEKNQIQSDLELNENALKNAKQRVAEFKQLLDNNNTYADEESARLLRELEAQQKGASSAQEEHEKLRGVFKKLFPDVDMNAPEEAVSLREKEIEELQLNQEQLKLAQETLRLYDDTITSQTQLQGLNKQSILLQQRQQDSAVDITGLEDIIAQKDNELEMLNEFKTDAYKFLQAVLDEFGSSSGSEDGDL